MNEGPLLQPSFIGSKTKTSNKKIGNRKTQGAQAKRPPMKKQATPKHKGLKLKTSDKKNRQLQNARGSNERPLMKKEATPKLKGLKLETSDEKRGNPKMHEAQIKGHR
jgi:hypothetical protein